MDSQMEMFLMQQLYATLFSVANKIQMVGDRYFESLTSRQYMAMMAIAHLKEDETSINNVARKLGTSKQSVKQLINILADKGYVIAEPSMKDRRAVSLKITEAGKESLVHCTKAGLRFFADLFRDFSAEEIAELWSSLKKLYRFDGEAQDGFEGDTTLELTEEQNKALINAFAEFEQIRRVRANQ